MAVFPKPTMRVTVAHAILELVTFSYSTQTILVILLSHRPR
jgi:hypothetical protein